MPSINRRRFIAGASATGAMIAARPWTALGSLGQVAATKTFSGDVLIPSGFTVPAGEVWEFDPHASTTVVVEENVVVLGTLRMRPSSASVVHELRFENVDESRFVGGGMEVLDTDVGLWVMGFGNLDVQGHPKAAWVRGGWDASWDSSDEVRVAPTAVGDFGSAGFARMSPNGVTPVVDVPATRVLSFVDTADSLFVDDIEAISAAGITEGVGHGRFAPDAAVTRGQMAAFLVRALELSHLRSSGGSGFTDTNGHWAEADIAALVASGITTGVSADRFAPDDQVTRAQMAVFLSRALDLAPTATTSFNDIAGHWAEDHIARVEAAGIAQGYDGDRFAPEDPVTRGQMAAFLTRALGLAAPAEMLGGRMSGEALNLTRNVRIRGTLAGRAHVMIHSASPQQIRYAELRFLGPRRVVGGVSEKVLGRYGLHFHHCGDGSRGSLVEGVVVAQSGSHAFVPHTSHGIVMRDCVSYDTYESPFWWDVKDRTNDLTWDRCVAALARSDPDYRGYRMAGFVLGHGDGLSVFDSVAVGIQGSKHSSGFRWPEFTGGLGPDGKKLEGVWTFDGCVAHNNRQNGIFTWQNTPEVHVVSNFVAYRCGRSGIEHGAYANPYAYSNAILHDVPVGVILHANSSDGPPLSFSNVAVSRADVGFRAETPRFPDAGPAHVVAPSFSSVGSLFEIAYTEFGHTVEDRFLLRA